jgi:arylsulfatase
MDGVSMRYAFESADAPGQKKTQYFEVFGSRAIYHDGYVASAFGPRIPWKPGIDPEMYNWRPDKDQWELYDLNNDFSQAVDLAADQPEKLEEMKALFLDQAKDNSAFPIGAGLWTALHPEYVVQNPATEFYYTSDVYEVPESTAPKLALRSSVVTLETELESGDEGVLYALGCYSGGVAAWVDQGKLNFEYNLYHVERTKVSSEAKLPTGKVKIEVETRVESGVRNGPAEIVLRVNGKQVANGRVPRTTGYKLSGNDTFDVGRDSFSPVATDYYDRAPFKFTGKIDKVHIQYVDNETK